MASSPVDIVGIYHQHIKNINDKNRQDRYDGKEHWYHASGAGSCSRKLYFESVEAAEPTNPMDERTYRLLRLGTMVHDDFEKSLHSYNTSIYTSYNKLSKKEKEINKEKEIFKFHTEGEITIKELNVRGFYDVVAEGDGVYLYDLKTCASYSWKLKFGGARNYNPSIQYELQLGTYGLAIQEKFGRLDGMYLFYYNKDNSEMKPVSVPLLYTSRAYMFWQGINEEHKRGLPGFKLGVSPVQKWQCKYCQFLDHCNPPK